MTQDEIDKILERGIATLDAAQIEMRDTYNKIEPYNIVPTLTGNCYRWDQIFIDNILLAFATDSLEQFSKEELRAFWNFVNFEDYHSTSALVTDANGGAVGCTIPDENNISYVVAQDGKVFIDNNGNKVRCQPPSYEVINEQAWKSLDRAMMSLYNCEQIDDCGRDDQYEETVPCPM